MHISSPYIIFISIIIFITIVIYSFACIVTQASQLQITL